MSISKKIKIVSLTALFVLFLLNACAEVKTDSINIFISDFSQFNWNKLNEKLNKGTENQKIAIHYLLGKKHFKENNFEKAYHNFSLIITNYKNSISTKFAYRVNVNKALSLNKMQKYSEAISLLLKEYKYINTTNDSLEQGKLLYDIGEVYYNWKRNELAGKYFQKAEIIFKQNGEIKLLANIYLKLGAVAQNMKLHEIAISYYQKSEKLSKINKFDKNYVNSLVNLGIEHIELDEFDKAATFLRIALAKSEQINYINGEIYALNHIARLFVAKNDNKNALNYLLKSKSIFKKTDNLEIKFLIFSNIATVYKLMKNYKKALFYFTKVYHLQKTNDNPAFLAQTQLNIAELQKLLTNYTLAEKYIDTCKITSEKASNERITISANFQLSEIYLFQNKTKEAEIILRSIFKKIKKTKNTELKSGVYLRLSDLYKIQNKYNKAFFFYEKHKALQEEIFEVAYSFQLGKIQNDSKMQLLNERLIVSNYQNEIKQKEINYQKKISVFISFGGIVFLIFSVLLFKLYTGKIKAYKELIKRNLELAEQILFEKEKQILQTHISRKITKYTDLIASLIHLLETEKIYLESNITLSSVSEILNTNRTYLSAATQEVLNTNFPNLINKYRIEKARIMLLQAKQKLSIEGIALSVGFKSKSSFNTAFKNFTGVTPSAMRKELKT